MKKSIVLTLLVVGGAQVVSAQRSDIPAPNQRAAVLARAEAVLGSKANLSDQFSNLRNPFILHMVAEPTVEKPVVRARGDREIVAALALQLQPTGSAELNGEKFLLLGQRKVKEGERIPMVFENGQYEVEVSSINGGVFTIRLNNEEFTRPIKPGKNQ